MSAAGSGVLAARKGLVARLARDQGEVRVAQRLRYEVFAREFGARLSANKDFPDHDIDPYDGFCDHLLIVAETPEAPSGFALEDGQLIGTYRLMRQASAETRGGFYSASEFQLDAMLEANSELNFAEVGRACVHADYRSKLVVDLMWKGIGAFVGLNKVDVLIGCASFSGTDPKVHALALSYLHHYHSASVRWPVGACAPHKCQMNMLDRAEIDPKAALKATPTLLKGYLRLGAVVCNEAVIDADFGTIDVLTIVPIASVPERYKERFGKPAN